MVLILTKYGWAQAVARPEAERLDRLRRLTPAQVRFWRGAAAAVGSDDDMVADADGNWGGRTDRAAPGADGTGRP